MTQLSVEPTYDSAKAVPSIKKEISELYKYRFLIWNFIFRNITARYKRSVLGIVWTMLEPLLTMTVMAVVFSAILVRAIPNFPVFLFSALIAWNYFNQSSSNAMNELKSGSRLMKKVYMPLSIYVLSSVGSGMVNLFLSTIIVFAIILVSGIPITAAVFFLPIGVLIITIFTIGAGLLVSTMSIFFSDIRNLYTILLRIIFYLSGTFYTIDRLPDDLKLVVEINPLYHMLLLFRAPLYSGEIPPTDSIIYGTIWAVGLLAIGMYIFTKYSDEFSYRL
jgi:ABC-type polysaccharide/polyol phosphate export permease